MSTQDQDPEQILADYSRAKLQCRVDRYRWGRKVSYEQMTPNFARRYKMCTDCGTQRWVEINTKTFEWTGRVGYHYAKGYLTTGTGLRLDDFRERLFREDYTDATKSGRIEYAPESAPEVVAMPKAKKAS